MVGSLWKALDTGTRQEGRRAARAQEGRASGAARRQGHVSRGAQLLIRGEVKAQTHGRQVRRGCRRRPG